MKILVLNYEFPPLGGGGSYVSHQIAEGLAAKGHQVDVVTMAFKGLPEKEVLGNMTIYRVKCWRTKKEMCHPWEQVTYLVSAYRFISQKLDVASYDVCHANFIIPTGWLALRLKNRYGLPYLLSAHGSDVIGYNPRFKALYPLLRGQWRKIVEGAPVLTCASEFLAGRVRETLPEANIAIIHHSIIGGFAPLPKEKSMLTVQRLFNNKRVNMIVGALNSIDMKGWKLYVVGDGPEMENLKNQAAGNPGIVFTGWIDHDDPRLAELYGKAAAFVFASAFENMPMTVIEALLSGCYPLLSDITGNRDIVKEDEYFFSDEAELAAKLKVVLERDVSKPFHYDLESFSLDAAVSHFEKLLVECKR